MIQYDTLILIIPIPYTYHTLMILIIPSPTLVKSLKMIANSIGEPKMNRSKPEVNCRYKKDSFICFCSGEQTFKKMFDEHF